MERVISWLQNALVRPVITVSLVGIAFLFSVAFSNGSSFQAQAEPYTPEATQYQVDSSDSPFQEKDKDSLNRMFQETKQPQTASETTQKLGEDLSKSQKTIKQNIESAADTVRDKLNLDQPLYPGTKEDLDDGVNAIKGDRD